MDTAIVGYMLRFCRGGGKENGNYYNGSDGIGII